MSLSELYEEYSRRLQQYTLLATNGKREPTMEECREAEAAADEWLRAQCDKQGHLAL